MEKVSVVLTVSNCTRQPFVNLCVVIIMFFSFLSYVCTYNIPKKLDFRKHVLSQMRKRHESCITSFCCIPSTIQTFEPFKLNEYPDTDIAYTFVYND